MYNCDKVDLYNKYVNTNMSHKKYIRKIPKIGKKDIQQQKLDVIYKYELGKINNKMTEIILQGEKHITTTLSEYKCTDIIKQQVEKICLLEKLKRKFPRHK